MDRLVLLLLFAFGPGIVTAEEYTKTVSETAGNGTVLWNGTHTYRYCSLTGTSPSTDDYFELITPKGPLVLVKPLDLEVLEPKFRIRKSDEAVISVEIQCTETERETKVNVSIHVTVTITPENEFPPIFLQAPYAIDIKEEVPKGTTIFSLHNRTDDRDALKYNQIVSFDVHPYLIGAFDGRRYFSVDRMTGEVTTAAKLDYETLERHNFVLNITATDNGGKISSPSDLMVNLTDIDDMPPEFRSPRPACTTNCLVDAYSRVVDIHFQGDLDDLKPYTVYARDGDLGIAAKMNYSIDYASDDELETNIGIDSVTGVLQVLAPYNNFTNVTSGKMEDPSFISTTIIATEISTRRRSANASFTLTVYRVLPTPPPKPTQPTSTIGSNVTMGTKSKEDNDNSSTLLLIEIFVPCCISVSALVAVIIFALFKRQKRKEMKYKVKEMEKETRRKSDMMESLPATMASPYDLVGAYAHIDLGTYDQSGIRDASGPSTDAEYVNQYNGVLPTSFDGLYTKVKMRAPRQTKMRAVDIVEADFGDGDDGVEEGATDDDVHQAGYTVQGTDDKHQEPGVHVATSEEDQSCNSIPDDFLTNVGGFDDAHTGGYNVTEELDDTVTFDDTCATRDEDNAGVADNDWPHLDHMINTERHYMDSD